MVHNTTVSFLTSMLRLPGENSTAPLERFYSYYDYTASYSDTPLAKAIEENAYQNIALTPRMLKELYDIEVDIDGLTPESTEVYHQKMTEQTRRRKIREVGQKLMRIAQGKDDTPIGEILAAVDVRDEQKQITMNLSTQTAVGMRMYNDRVASINSGEVRFAFPWDCINRAVPFVYPDDMILLSGQSKYGKSSAAHQIAMYNASRMKVLYFHNEDNPMKMFLRRIAQYQLALDSNPLQSGGPAKAGTISYRDMVSAATKSDEFMDKVEKSANEIIRRLGDNLVYVYCPGWTAEQIVNEIVLAKRQNEIGLVVVDYLNKIESYDKAVALGTMANAYEYTVEILKRESGRAGHMCPTLLIQQENEDGGVRASKSSYILSQVHLSVDRDSNGDGMENTGTLRIKRANDGETGTWPAMFYPDYMSWLA